MNTDKKITLEIQTGLPDLGVKIIQVLNEQIRPPAVVFLHGDLGAGKTTLVQHFLAARAVQNFLGSPTFNLRNEYALPDGLMVFHLDLYRIKESDNQTELFEFLNQYENIIAFIEWPSLVKHMQIFDGLQQIHVRIELANGGRRYTVEVA